MPEFQLGDKKRQRTSSERMRLACCWDRRRAIKLLSDIVGTDTSGKWINGDLIEKASEFLEELRK